LVEFEELKTKINKVRGEKGNRIKNKMRDVLENSSGFDQLLKIACVLTFNPALPAAG
jgi:hypothetical protein